jgi:TolB-like protein
VTAIPFESISPSDHKAVREELDRILKSDQFLQSQRRRRFLEYIVNETLAGRSGRLKGYNIAREVFDRPEEFDPNTDSIVRMEAARLRDRLREYYEGDGRNDPLRIELPKGTYTPQIEFRQNVGTPSADRDRFPAGSVVAVKEDAPLPPHPVWKRWQIVASAAALVLLMAGAGMWFAGSHWQPAPKEPAEAGQSFPSVPAVAVLPFVNLSGDPKQEYFSDGLTEDILTELSRARDLRVLARNTTFQFKGKAVDVAKLGRELGVRYVLEGSVRRADDRLRVTAQLIDTKTGTHIWADRYDREMADVYLVQDEIVNQIAAKIAGSYGVIESTEAKSAARKSSDQIQAYDLFLRARSAMQWTWTAATFNAARDFLRQAIALDPSTAQARRELAWLTLIGWIFRFDETPVRLEEITAQATKAVELDPADARARMVVASAYFFGKQLDLFEHEAQQALVLAPYDAEIAAILGSMIALSGQWQRGVALVRKANALNAHAAIGWYQSTMSLDYYLNGNYERALELQRQNPDQETYYAYIESIPIYGQLGRRQEALKIWRKLLEEEPSASAETFEYWFHLWNMRDEDIAKLMEGVYKSGVLGVEAKLAQ